MASPNPRVEGIMVSAPPHAAFEYKQTVEAGSEEERTMEVLRTAKDWA